MRKSTLFFLMLIALCVSAQPISEQEALKKAQQFLQGRNIVSAGAQGQLRRAAKTHPYKHLYLFNAENNGGFVIVAGDSRAQEILGYSDEGNLDYDQMPDNMKWWLSLYDESIANIPDDMTDNQEPVVRRASKADVAPMMRYSWSQNSPLQQILPGELRHGMCTTCHGTDAGLSRLSGYIAVLRRLYGQQRPLSGRTELP